MFGMEGVQQGVGPAGHLLKLPLNVIIGGKLSLVGGGCVPGSWLYVPGGEGRDGVWMVVDGVGEAQMTGYLCRGNISGQLPMNFCTEFVFYTCPSVSQYSKSFNLNHDLALT